MATPWIFPQGVPQVAPSSPPSSPAIAHPPPQGMNAGTVLVLGILASGIVLWIQGKHRASEQEREAKIAAERLDEAAFDLDGAREDAQMALARAFAHRPMGPLSWGP